MQGGGVSSNSTTTSSTTTTNNGGLSEIPTLQDLQNHLQTSHFDPTGHEDFLDQMLSSLPAWAELQSPSPNPNKSPWDLNAQNANQSNTHFNRARDLLESRSISNPHDGGLGYQQHDESVLLASRLRHHQISGGGGTQPQLMMGRGGGGGGMGRSPAGADSGGLPLPLPLSLSTGADPSNGEGLFNGLSRSQQFNHLQNGSISSPNFGSATGANQSGVGGNGGGGGAPPVRQRVRARRGQATDPHSIAERLRRERIAERMKGLQELVPNANKTDKASMLDEIIDYVKFLQLQVKVLSMSRLGGAAAVAPLVADISSEGGGDSLQVSGKGHGNNGAQTTPTNGSSSITEHQVAKLMEEDMGSAMQYLQGKGLCLMPISLATAISTATCNSRNPKISNPFFSSALDGPSSPSLSVLTVQSATMGNGIGEASIKDATSVSKP